MSDVGTSAPLRWHQRPGGVLLLLFVVLGPFGLPYLWRSPAFSRTAKRALTVAVLVYTVVLAQETVAAYRTLRQQLDVLEDVS